MAALQRVIFRRAASTARFAGSSTARTRTSNAIHYRAMSGGRQLSVWTRARLVGRGSRGQQPSMARGTDYSGRAYAVTLGVLAFFLAVQLLFAAGNLGERLARADRPPHSAC